MASPGPSAVALTVPSPSVPDSRLHRRRRAPRRSCLSSCGRCMTSVLASSICVGGLFVAYIFAGGFLFKKLELNHEIIVSSPTFSTKAIDDVTATAEEIWLLAEKTIVERSNTTSHELTSILRRLQARTMTRTTAILSPWSPPETGKVRLRRWSLPGSVLFCVSLLTTVGYADMAPQTRLGRMLTIPYALIGIPLAFYFLSRIGRDLVVVFRSFYRRIFCDLFCCKLCQRRYRRKQYDTTIALTSRQDGAAVPVYVGHLAARRRRQMEISADTKRQSHVYESIVGEASTSSNRLLPVPEHYRLTLGQSDSSVYRVGKTIPIRQQLTPTSSEAVTGSLPNRHRLHRAGADAQLSPLIDKYRQGFEGDEHTQQKEHQIQKKANFQNETQSLDRAKLKKKPKASISINSHDTGENTGRSPNRCSGDVTLSPPPENNFRWSNMSAEYDAYSTSPLRASGRRGGGSRETTSGSRRPSAWRSSNSSFGVRKQASSPPYRKDKGTRYRKSPKKKTRLLTSAENAASGGVKTGGGYMEDLMNKKRFMDGSDESFVTAPTGTPLMARMSIFKRRSNRLIEDENIDDEDDIIDQLEFEESHKINLKNKSPASPIIEISMHEENSKPLSGAPGDELLSPEIVDHDVNESGRYGMSPSTASTFPLPICLLVLGVYLICGATLLLRSSRRCSGSTGSGNAFALNGGNDWYTSIFVSFVALTTINGWYPVATSCVLTPSDQFHDEALFQWPPDFRYLYSAWLIGGLSLVAMLVRLVVDCFQAGSNISDCCRGFDKRHEINQVTAMEANI